MFHFNKAGVQKQVYSIKVKKLLTMNRLPMFDFVQRSAMNTSYAKTFYWVKMGRYTTYTRRQNIDVQVASINSKK